MSTQKVLLIQILEHWRTTMTTENSTDQIEIKLTKVMTKILKHYEVKLRNKPQLVTHKAYETTTLVSPSVYAVYEAAIKANYVVTFMSL